MSTGRFIFFTLWALVMSLSLFVAVKGVDYFSQDGRAVAKLFDYKGDVKSRPMDFSIWEEVAEKQKFYEGNVVATGDNSRARVLFIGGQLLDIAENTQVVITLDPNSDGDGFLITLLKGSLSAKSLVLHDETKDTPSLKIKSGTKVVDLKNQLKPLVLENIVKKKKKKLPKIIAVVKAKPTPDPMIAMMAKKKAQLKRMSPRIIFPPDGATLWTVKSLKSGNSGTLPVKLSPTGGGASITSVLKISGQGKGSVTKPTKQGNGQASVDIASATIRRFAVQSYRNGGREWTLDLKPGATSILAGKQVSSFSRGTRKVKFQSLSDFGSGSIGIYLSGMRFKDLGKNQWFVQRGSLSSAMSRTTIHLVTATDLPKLAPVLKASGRFGMAPERNSVNGKGVFVVKNNRIIAKIQGQLGDLKSLRKALGASLIFRGEKSAFVKTLSSKQAKDSWKGLYKISGKAYLYSGNKIVTINRRLLNENPVAAQFVAQAAKAVFLKPVQILDSGL